MKLFALIVIALCVAGAEPKKPKHRRKVFVEYPSNRASSQNGQPSRAQSSRAQSSRAQSSRVERQEILNWLNPAIPIIPVQLQEWRQRRQQDQESEEEEGRQNHEEQGQMAGETAAAGRSQSTADERRTQTNGGGEESNPTQTNRGGERTQGAHPGEAEETKPGCGGILEVSRTYTRLTSPGFPQPYENNLDCIWILVTPNGSSIDIRYNNMSLEFQDDCIYDYVAIYEVSTDGFTTLGRSCGSVVPSQTISSSTNVVAIHFRTDGSENGAGFVLQYKQGCGGTLEVSRTYTRLTSPGFPQPYENNLGCHWILVAPNGSSIDIRFNNMSLEFQDDCIYDYVAIDKVSTDGFTTLGRFCGSVVPSQTISSSTNVVAIRFRTDGSENGAGFALQYKQGTHSTTRRLTWERMIQRIFERQQRYQSVTAREPPIREAINNQNNF